MITGIFGLFGVSTTQPPAMKEIVEARQQVAVAATEPKEGCCSEPHKVEEKGMRQETIHKSAPAPIQAISPTTQATLSTQGQEKGPNTFSHKFRPEQNGWDKQIDGEHVTGTEKAMATGQAPASLSPALAKNKDKYTPFDERIEEAARETYQGSVNSHSASKVS